MPRIRPLRFSTLVAVTSLAAAVGSFGASLVLLDALVLHPVRVDQPQQVLHLGGLATNIPGYDAQAWWAQAEALEAVGLYATQDAVVEAGGLRRVEPTVTVSTGYFDVVRHTPAAGRLLTPADASLPGVPPAVVSASMVGLQTCLGLIVLVGAAYATRDLVGHLTFDTGQRPRMDATVVPLRVVPAEPVVQTAAWQAVWNATASLPTIEEVVLLSDVPVRPAQGFLFVADIDPPVMVARRFYRGRFNALVGLATRNGSVTPERDPEPSIVLSRSAAAAISGGADVPAAMRFAGGAVELRVAGVIDDVRFLESGGVGESAAYVPIADAPALNAGIRTMSLLFTCRTTCTEADRTAVLSAIGPYAEPIGAATTLQALYEPAARPAKARAAFANLYAAVALLVVLVGVYTLSGAVVLGSAFETGIRLALGARNADVVLRLLSRACTPAALGVAAGSTLLLVVTDLIVEGGGRLPAATDLVIAATLLLTTSAIAALGPALFLVRQPLVSLLRRER